MHVTFLGFTIPDRWMDELLESDRHMPAQTHAFAWALVDALRASSVEVNLLSSVPATSYPGNPRVLFRGGSFSARGLAGSALPFVNVIVLKHFTRLLSCLTVGTRALRMAKPQVLLVHGVHSPYLIFAVLARGLARVRSVVVLTDPPGVPVDGDSTLASLLKRLDVNLVRWALRRVDGVVALTGPLATDLAAGTPALIMEGIFAEPTGAPTLPSERPASDGTTVMYAGGLLPGYGVDRLLEAFRWLEAPAARLAVFGKGPLSDAVSRLHAQDARVQEPRFVDRLQIREACYSADLLVQPRPTGEAFVPYSFPSKLLDYMASGTPVLSTRLSGIPGEYEPYLYWIEDDSAAGIAEALRAVLALPESERRRKGRDAARFVRETRDASSQGARIRAFLEQFL